MTSEIPKSLAILVISVYLAFVAIFSFLNIGITYESPVLLATLNTFFCAAVGLLVVYLAARSYRATRSGPVLFMGCGALAFAITYILAGLLLSNLNAAVTVHNTGVFLSAFFFVLSAVWALTEKTRGTSTLPPRYLEGAYLGVFVIMALLALASLGSLTPVFFDPVTGMTMLRQIVLVLTVVEFAVAAACLGILYFRAKTSFLLWYSLSTMLIGIGMGVLIFEGTPATPLSWMGRAGQYLGGLYLLAAVLSLEIGGGDWRIPLDKALQRERDFTSRLLSTVGGLVIVLDRDGDIIRFNRACERSTGFRFEEVRGRKFWDLFILPEEIQGVKDTFAVLQSGRFPNEHENFWVARDGTRRYIHWSNTAMTGPDGSVEYVIGTGIDITDRMKAEEELKQRNDDLNALNEELTSTQEELQENVEELTRREEDLSKALAEKEILLSEIHHRVKNNLTAFISLLSLEGTIEESPAGKQLKIDLQNRARSMALVHETLYRTHLFNDVDMEMYLTTLLDQISQSFQTTKAVKTVVHAKGIMLDIPRATPTGLIINELVTNSFKYAFPASFDVQAVRNASPTITLTLTKNDGEYTLISEDNGVGVPAGFELAKTQTLGLKLVNFLAKHQMRAKVEVDSANGTKFIFRFRE